MTQVVETLVENRRASRTQLSWPISLWLPEANRFFNGKTINVAKGGVLLSKSPFTFHSRGWATWCGKGKAWQWQPVEINK